jgi:hypothetical protein
MILAIDNQGVCRAVYTDDCDYYAISQRVIIRRASHVEPSPDGRGWCADMSPVGGPMIGPYPTRAAALAAEVGWIETHVLS